VRAIVESLGGRSDRPVAASDAFVRRITTRHGAS